MKRSAGTKWILLAFLILLMVFGGLVVRKYWLRSAPPVTQAPSPVETPHQAREVILYFASEDGNRLVPEVRELNGCQDQEDCIRATIQALIHGPVGNLVPVLPAHTILLSLTEEGGTAVADFNADLQKGHPGGSMSELLTVYSLVDTLASNYPHIRQLKILVEGSEVETLKGHVDLRRPVQADFSLVRRQPADTPGGEPAPGTIIEQEVKEGGG
jgi:spore germination protein GerM